MKNKKTHIKLKDRTLENDIKFRGPLSYRHLRIIGWVFLVLAQIAMILKFNMKLNADSTLSLTPAYDVFSFMSSLPLPLFLIANFAIIIQKKDSIKKLVIFYLGVATLMYLIGTFVTMHYVHGLIQSFTSNYYSYYNASLLMGTILSGMGRSGYALNIFIDLLLCSLILFFATYKPKKIFKDKYLIIFRLFVILPIAYEIAGMFLKMCINLQAIEEISTFWFLLLPSKPPMLFFAYVVIVFLLKIGELNRKKRKDYHDFSPEHLKTNAHSLRVSIMLTIVFFIFIVLDIFALFLGGFITYGMHPDLGRNGFLAGLIFALSLGFGDSAVSIFILPVVLLFSYNKTHKNKKVDTLIPVAGIALVAFIYLEGMYQVLSHNIPIILDKIRNWIEGLFNKGEDGEPEPSPLHHIAESIKAIIRK